MGSFSILLYIPEIEPCIILFNSYEFFSSTFPRLPANFPI